MNAGNIGDPSYSPIFADSGNGIWGLCFSADNKNYAYCDFHINRDYKIGTKIYPHIHWMPLSYSTGNVKWVFEYIFAKGHGQNETLIAPTSTFSVVQAGKGMIGEHMVGECTDNQTFVVSEPDTVVRVKVYRDGTSVDDTFYGSVIGLMMDFHYQSDRETAPDETWNGTHFMFPMDVTLFRYVNEFALLGTNHAGLILESSDTAEIQKELKIKFILNSPSQSDIRAIINIEAYREFTI